MGRRAAQGNGVGFDRFGIIAAQHTLQLQQAANQVRMQGLQQVEVHQDTLEHSGFGVTFALHAHCQLFVHKYMDINLRLVEVPVLFGGDFRLDRRREPLHISGIDGQAVTLGIAESQPFRVAAVFPPRQTEDMLRHFLDQLAFGGPDYAAISPFRIPGGLLLNAADHGIVGINQVAADGRPFRPGNHFTAPAVECR